MMMRAHDRGSGAARHARTIVGLLAAGVLASACAAGTGSVATGADGTEAVGTAPPAASPAASDPTAARTEATTEPGAPASPEPAETPAPSAAPSADPSATPSPDSSSPPDGDESEPAEPDGPRLAPAAEGDTGEDVTALQRRLDALGYAPGPVDGIYGDRTVESVAAFQHAADLDPTGGADDATVAALSDADPFAVLAAGEEGAAVEALQERLADAPLDPGPADGVYGPKTVEAVYTLEKLAGIAVDGVFDGTDAWAVDRLQAGELAGGDAAVAPRRSHDRRWVEVDLSRQVMRVYDPGRDTPVLASHVSTGTGERWCNDTAGCRVASTPTGSFTITRRIDGWRESSLDVGRLYNPLYFVGGVALHGAPSVPLHPASHGCVRVPMHIAEYLPDLLPNGTPVDVIA